MERRSEGRDIGLPNSSMGYCSPPQIIQESPVKLPLAPILPTPHDSRGTAMVSTRRGSSIFSPTQTLDPPHHYHQFTPPPPLQPLVQDDPTPDPDPPPPQAAGAATASIRYKECLKNHAASMGGHVLDGCGEFMPNGEEGTPEALRCAACDCHRNFHRQQLQGEPQQSHFHHTPLIHAHGFSARAMPTTMVSFGGNSGGGAAAESSSEDLNLFQSSDGGGDAAAHPSKKRFRTKFSQDQKDRMHEFASKLGWRIQKQDEQEVVHFCSEVGVKRQIFKVWMHNNKQAMKKRSQSS